MVEKKIALIVSLGLLLAVMFSAAFYLHHEKSQFETLLLKQARTLHSQIQITRQWNAKHGGVYAFLNEGQKPNPYLYKVGPRKGVKANIDPELTDQKGRKLALINPATMTRELSIETRAHSSISFQLTSLKLINPNNKPDVFEKKSLKLFENGILENTQYTEKNGQPYFRYMAPLKIENSCLECHGFQGYQVGDIRGGISVTIPMSEEIAFSNSSRIQVLYFALLTFLSTMLFLTYAIRRLIGKPLKELAKMGENIGTGTLSSSSDLCYDDELGNLSRVLIKSDQSLQAQRNELETYAAEMKELALNDSLTGLPNRRLLFDRLTEALNGARRYSYGVAVLFIDLDRFKTINDTLGHEMGDALLMEVAVRLKSCVRNVDTVARIGGDEFSIILSHIGNHKDDWMVVAKKVITQLTQTFKLGEEECCISCSIGISKYPSDGQHPEELLRKADEAMYAVKHLGRNNFIRYSAQWSNVISMSNSKIDEEHARMLTLLDDLNNKVEAQEFDIELVLQVLHRLFHATIEHFAHEEALFSEHNYPDTKNHIVTHQEVIKKLKSYLHDLQHATANRQSCAEMCFDIQDLLIGHILKEDIKYIKYLS